MFTTAEKAAKLIAKYVGYKYPDNKEELFEILTLVNDRIWNEGSWWGMTAEFYVSTRKGPNNENYIVCPPNYDILKAVNVNGNPVLPRDRWFQFHKNGSGTIDKSCGNWTESVVDLGEYPTINDIFQCTNDARPDKILIGATLTGEETSTNPPKLVRVQGEWDRGGEVYTYERESFPANKIEFLNEEQGFHPVFGAKIALNNKLRFIENIWWKKITNITKDVTVNPVEVYAIHNDENKTLQLIAVMGPHQTYARHRRYLVPDDACIKSCNCSNSCSCPPVVHGMFKISEPEEIVYDTQTIYTRSREALISLAIGVSEMFNKKKPENSIPFTLNGIKALEDNNRENQSDDIFPIQVTGPYLDDIHPAIRLLDY